MISKLIQSKVSGYLLIIFIIGAMVSGTWLFWRGYDLCRAGNRAAIASDQKAQIDNEIELSRDVERKKRERVRDEASGLDLIYNAIERLY